MRKTKPHDKCANDRDGTSDQKDHLLSLVLVLVGVIDSAEDCRSNCCTSLTHSSSEAKEVTADWCWERFRRDQEIVVARANAEEALEQTIQNDEQREDTVKLEHSAANDEAEDRDYGPTQSISLLASQRIDQERSQKSARQGECVDKSTPTNTLKHSLVARETFDQNRSQEVEWVDDEVIQEPGGATSKEGSPIHSQSESVWIVLLDGMLLVLFRVEQAHTEEEDCKRELEGMSATL